jgi:glycogen debranching enzyme
MINETEVAAIAARLVAPDMSTGFGLRTMSGAAGGFSPLSYHCGAVWPHDTVIVAQALASAGHGAAAASLVHGLLRAAPAFGYRLPELYGGDARSDLPQPAAYQAACHPQAWAAAAGIGILTVLTGVRPDVPRGVVHIAPPVPGPMGALTVRGLRVGGSFLGLDIGADGRAVVVQAPGSLAVTDQPPMW